MIGKIKKIIKKRIRQLTKLKKYDEAVVGIKTEISGNVKLGKGTNIKSGFIHGGKDGVVIGKYCAIAHNLRIRSTNHKVCYANLQSYFMVEHDIPFDVHGESKGVVMIGNNVWIGDNVIILPGVSIGDGAIVGAGSVVTKDIPNYSIAVGVPARVIKKRFEDDMIDFLNTLKWWDWSSEKVKANKAFFQIDLTKVDTDYVKKVLN